eukprot:6300374-Amphidinium_carterae.1
MFCFLVSRAFVLGFGFICPPLVAVASDGRVCLYMPCIQIRFFSGIELVSKSYDICFTISTVWDVDLSPQCAMSFDKRAIMEVPLEVQFRTHEFNQRTKAWTIASSLSNLVRSAYSIASVSLEAN